MDQTVLQKQLSFKFITGNESLNIQKEGYFRRLKIETVPLKETRSTKECFLSFK